MLGWIRNRGRRVLRNFRGEQGRPERGVERLPGADDGQRREFYAKPGQQHAEPYGRDLQQRHRPRAGNAELAGLSLAQFIRAAPGLSGCVYASL
jgi:hypothetical protein